MIEYVDAFREEAKSLFSAYKNKEKDAVARCAKVFGDKTDLTLMNIQHVIAKEYGFNQWKGVPYSTPERLGIKGPSGEPFDLIERQKRGVPYVHINNTDVSMADFSKFDMSLATFDDWTI